MHSIWVPSISIIFAQLEFELVSLCIPRCEPVIRTTRPSLPRPSDFVTLDSTTCWTVLILSCSFCCTVYETIAGFSPWMQFCVWWDILVLYCVWWCATCGVCKITPSCLHEPGRWARRRNLHAWMTQMRDFSVVSLGIGSRVKACGSCFTLVPGRPSG